MNKLDGWFNTKGFALVIPLLPPRARERGAVKLPHTHERRLFLFVQGQGCASPVLPFVRTVRRVRTSRERGPGPVWPLLGLKAVGDVPTQIAKRAVPGRLATIQWREYPSAFVKGDVPVQLAADSQCATKAISGTRCDTDMRFVGDHPTSSNGS